MPKYTLLIGPDSLSICGSPVYLCIDKKLLVHSVTEFLLNNYKDSSSRHQRQQVGYLVLTHKGQRADGLEGHNPGKLKHVCVLPVFCDKDFVRWDKNCGNIQHFPFIRNNQPI